MNYSLVWNTVRYLRPVQVVYQVLNRFKEKERKYFDKLPVECREVRIAIPELDCDGLLVKRFKPEWMQKANLEWFYRLIKNPSRLGRMMKLPLFLVHVAKEK